MRSGEYAKWGLVTLTCQHRAVGRRRGEIAGQLARFVLIGVASALVLYLPPDLLSMRRRTRRGLTDLLT